MNKHWSLHESGVMMTNCDNCKQVKPCLEDREYGWLCCPCWDYLIHPPDMCIGFDNFVARAILDQKGQFYLSGLGFGNLGEMLQLLSEDDIDFDDFVARAIEGKDY